VFGWLRSLRGKGRPPVERLARAIGSVGLPMQPEAAVVTQVERSSGAPVPGRILDFLCAYPSRGISPLDPERHARHSPALAQLLASIEKEFQPLGAVGPSAEDLRAGRAWWYLVFQARPGVRRFIPWDGYLAVRPAKGEEPVARAEARYGIALPPSYRHLLCVFDQVLHSALHLHEGIMGPERGAGVEGFEAELDYIRTWFKAAGQDAGSPASGIDDYLPFYADAYGNEYLFERRNPGPVFRFDHELCAIGGTSHADFDAFVSALLSGGIR